MLVVCGTIINQTSQHTLYSTNTEEIYYQSTTIPIMNNFEIIHMSSAIVYQSVLQFTFVVWILVPSSSSTDTYIAYPRIDGERKDFLINETLLYSSAAAASGTFCQVLFGFFCQKSKKTIGLLPVDFSWCKEVVRTY